MSAVNKRDLPNFLLRANIVSFFIMITVAVLQFILFYMLNGSKKTESTVHLLNLLLFLALLTASMAIH